MFSFALIIASFIFSVAAYDHNKVEVSPNTNPGEVVKAQVGDYAVELKKSFIVSRTAETNDSVEVTLSFLAAKSSGNNDTPDTGDSINTLAPLLMFASGSLILFLFLKKKAFKGFIALSLMFMLIQATFKINAAASGFEVDEDFNADVLQDFDFNISDVVVSGGNFSVKTGTGGQPIGIHWEPLAVETQQKLVYILTFKAEIPEAGLNHDFDVAHAVMHYKDTNGKVTDLAYNDVKMSLNANLVVPVIEKFSITYHLDDHPRVAPDPFVATADVGETLLVGDGATIFGMTNINYWTDCDGNKYYPGDPVTSDLELYANWTVTITFYYMLDIYTGIYDWPETVTVERGPYELPSVSKIFHGSGGSGWTDKDGNYIGTWKDIINVVDDIDLYAIIVVYA